VSTLTRFSDDRRLFVFLVVILFVFYDLIIVIGLLLRWQVYDVYDSDNPRFM
jgi:hypothetical protein